MSTPKIQVLGLQTESEYDYIITKLEDFTTEKLATMSGRVLVKGIHHEAGHALYSVTVPASVTTIKFLDCDFYYTSITALSKGTRIIGFSGYGVSEYHYCLLKNFGGVKDCHGQIEVDSCSNIIHCTIKSAIQCTNLQDIYCYFDAEDPTDARYMFDRCTLIDGVIVSSFVTNGDEEPVLEFKSCNHINNVHRLNSSTVVNYSDDCQHVDGDTCDGYYTEEDNGKVQAVNTDGSKALISVYSQEEIDSKLGDIGSILSALHEGGIT